MLVSGGSLPKSGGDIASNSRFGQNGFNRAPDLGFPQYPILWSNCNVLSRIALAKWSVLGVSPTVVLFLRIGTALRGGPDEEETKLCPR